jgi:diacylglycerol kinase family enzyme
MRATLFHNPKAGMGDHSKEELVAALRLARLDVSYCSTKSSDFEDALKEPADLVVVAGGDGTITKVLKQWRDRTVPIGIVPLGTANNIATTLGLAGEAEDLAPRWSLERTRRLDIGRATGPWGECRFVEAVGFGALARSTDKGVGTKSNGDKRLLLGRDAFRQALCQARSRISDLAVDGQPVPCGVLAVEILNIGFAGPRLPLCPSSDPGDGLLDIVCVRAEQREKMLDWLAAPEQRMPPPVSVTRGRGATFTWDCKEPLRIDDEFPACPDGPESVTVELELEGVKVLVPQPLERRQRSRNRQEELER